MHTGVLDASNEQQLASLCSSWELSSWDELDWGRAKLLSVRDTLEARQQDLEQAQGAHCLACPNFVKHVGTSVTDSMVFLTVHSFRCATMSGLSRRTSRSCDS